MAIVGDNMQTYQIIFLIFANCSSLILGCYFIFNGVFNGIVRKKILVRNTDQYTHGPNALKFGVVQLFFGLVLIVFSIVFFLAILKDFF